MPRDIEFYERREEARIADRKARDEREAKEAKAKAPKKAPEGVEE